MEAVRHVGRIRQRRGMDVACSMRFTFSKAPATSASDARPVAPSPFRPVDSSGFSLLISVASNSIAQL
jgi:hypothetical protein